MEGESESNITCPDRQVARIVEAGCDFDEQEVGEALVDVKVGDHCGLSVQALKTGNACLDIEFDIGEGEDTNGGAGVGVGGPGEAESLGLGYGRLSEELLEGGVLVAKYSKRNVVEGQMDNARVNVRLGWAFGYCEGSERLTPD